MGTGSWSGSTNGWWLGWIPGWPENRIEMCITWIAASAKNIFWHLAARYLILRRNIQALRGGFQLDSVEPGWRGQGITSWSIHMVTHAGGCGLTPVTSHFDTLVQGSTELKRKQKQTKKVYGKPKQLDPRQRWSWYYGTGGVSGDSSVQPQRLFCLSLSIYRLFSNLSLSLSLSLISLSLSLSFYIYILFLKKHTIFMVREGWVGSF